MTIPVYHALSPDRFTLVVKRRTPAGILTTTLHRDTRAGPFTDDDVTAALASTAKPAGMQDGQRNRSRRAVTRYGTFWWHVMLGPPTWWAPRVRFEKDGTVMAGWLRAAVAAKYERAGASPAEGEGETR